jgi:hypothetical protein
MYTFLTGDNGIYSESLTDQCLIDIITELLQKTFPDLKVTAPKRIYRYSCE